MKSDAARKFKSDRAAKSAYTKAERAYDAAWNVRVEFENANRPLPCVEEGDVGAWADEARLVLAELASLKANEEVAFSSARSIYDAAKAQNIFISSWHFGANATRDLIAQNID